LIVAVDIAFLFAAIELDAFEEFCLDVRIASHGGAVYKRPDYYRSNEIILKNKSHTPVTVIRSMPLTRATYDYILISLNIGNIATLALNRGRIITIDCKNIFLRL
jgi:hypothetical protein